MQRFSSHLLIALLAAPLALVSSTAFAAGSDACGNIALVANGNCKVEVSGGCTGDCQPIAFVAACDGQCTLSADASCTGGCEASCETKCNVDPPSFDCSGECTASCEASCSDSCTGTTGDCVAQCKGSCSNRCNIECTATPGSADCSTKCKASCGASCTVQANVNCSLECSAKLEGGCKVDCEAPEGALFCDGQYVDVTNIDECIAYLETQGFNVSANASCNANGCEASVGCAASPYIGPANDRLAIGSVAGLMVGLGLVASRRRRRS
jgi:hypothetical protein